MEKLHQCQKRLHFDKNEKYTVLLFQQELILSQSKGGYINE